MLGLTFSFEYLAFRRSSAPPAPVPEGLRRYWLPTPGGELELLAAEPAGAAGPALLFCHGGMGGAWVWTEYLQFLRARGVRAYAISLRGHGDSWCPSFLRMVYGTTRTALEADLVAAVHWVEEHTGGPVVLAGHSSGGGLAQAVLGAGKATARGLALLGAVPAFGSTRVYLNWARLDPWFSLRMLCHLWHPVSPLSHPALTRAAFFGPAFPAEKVAPFQARISRFESFWWPFSMLRPFATAAQILRSVTSRKVLVMAGAEDRLMDNDVTRNTAAIYRAETDDVTVELVPGAGHHLQNDVQWEDGAERLLKWSQSL